LHFNQLNPVVASKRSFHAADPERVGDLVPVAGVGDFVVAPATGEEVAPPALGEEVVPAGQTVKSNLHVLPAQFGIGRQPPTVFLSLGLLVISTLMKVGDDPRIELIEADGTFAPTRLLFFSLIKEMKEAPLETTH